MPIGLSRRDRIAAAILLISTVLLLSVAAAQEAPARKIDIDKLTCRDLTTLPRERHDRLLIYLNGYFDGIQKATSWDAELVAKRIDEVVRLCKADPKLALLDAFKRAWNR